MTSTQTETESSTEDYSSTGKSFFDLDPEAKLDLAPTPTDPVDLSGLNKRVPTKKPSFFNDNVDRVRGPGQTKSRYIIHKKKTSYVGPIVAILALLLLAGGGFYFWQMKSKAPVTNLLSNLPIPTKSPEVTPEPAAPTPAPPPTFGQNDYTSRQPPPPMYTVIIQSVPAGARISIDGQDTGMITPAQKTIESGKEFTIALRKEGFQYYERKERISENGFVIKASLLPMPKMGYINLNLVNGGSNPVVIINGMRIEEKLPLKNYAVVAGAPVKIEVHNPFTGLAGEQTVTVQANQKIQVNLLLGQRVPSQAK